MQTGRNQIMMTKSKNVEFEFESWDQMMTGWMQMNGWNGNVNKINSLNYNSIKKVSQLLKSSYQVNFTIEL